MLKPTFAKVILRDGVLTVVPDDFAERHELVRVTHPLLAEPFLLAAYAFPEAKSWDKAIPYAAEQTIYGKPMQAADVERRFLAFDRTVFPSLPVLFFPDAKDHSWEWTATVDVEDPQDTDETAGYAWGVDVDTGYADRNHRSDHSHVRGVVSGQYSDLGVVES